MTQQKIFEGARPMDVFVFFTGGASSLRAMLEDPNYGNLYRVVGAYTDREEAKGREVCRSAGIPEFHISRGDFYKEFGLDPKSWDSRRRFYDSLLPDIGEFNPDLICLSGYMHYLNGLILEEYRNRILNVHPGDLSLLGDGSQTFDLSLSSPQAVAMLIADVKSRSRKMERAYKGKQNEPAKKAIMDGETETRSTIHIVTEEFDEGAIVVQSKPFSIDPAIRKRTLAGDAELLERYSAELLERYSAELQEKMKWGGDGPAYLKALELIASGRLSAEDDTVEYEDQAQKFTTLFLDGNELPYCGFRMG